jgi:TetR/AcrR family transcriptional regulator, regulator of biofilm formation and stress response
VSTNDRTVRVEPRTRRRRGVQRRQELLEATLRLLAREGSAAVTMRAVAGEAGVPSTAPTYYFASKQELLLEAWRLHAEREADRVDRATEAVGIDGGSSGAIARRLALFVHDSLGAARESLLAEIALLLEAARQPELEELTRVWHQTLQAHVRDALAAAGSSHPELDARLLLAVTAGLELDNVGTDCRATVPELKELFTRLLGALLP